MGIKIGNTSWNVMQVLKMSQDDFVNAPQHRHLVPGSEEKKTKDLTEVYSICKVQSKLFPDENDRTNAEAGEQPEHEADSQESSQANASTDGAGEPRSAPKRSKRKRNGDTAILQAGDIDVQAAEGTGDTMGDIEG